MAVHDMPLLQVDSRRRVTLGKLATATRYQVAVRPDGSILLTPVPAVPPGRVPSVPVPPRDRSDPDRDTQMAMRNCFGG
jgi:hypothetical protein